MSNEINVLFTIDENYILPMMVSMLSIQQNSKCDKCNFAVIATETVINLVKKTFDEAYIFDEREKVRFICMDEAAFGDVKIYTTHITKTSFYRLMACDLLPEWNKCIYLDPDTIVSGDLAELFTIDIEEYYVGAVHAFIDKESYPQINKLKENVVKNLSNYFNAGILLMNLKKMRFDKMSQYFIEQSACNFQSEDQDILNVCCSGQVKYLPLKFNLPSRYYGRAELICNETINFTEIEEANTNPCIIHFLGSQGKPWQLRCGKGADIWWKFAKKICECQEYKDMLEKCIIFEKKWDWEYFSERIKRKKWIIFAYTDYSKRLFDMVSDISEIIGFCDNDINKQGANYNNRKVYSFDELDANQGYGVIIANQSAKASIRNSLREKGFSEDDIVDYYQKNRLYYLALDSKYYENEIRQIMVLEKEKNIKELSYEGIIKFIQKEQNKALLEKLILNYWINDWLLSDNV